MKRRTRIWTTIAANDHISPTNTTTPEASRMTQCSRAVPGTRCRAERKGNVEWRAVRIGRHRGVEVWGWEMRLLGRTTPRFANDSWAAREMRCEKEKKVAWKRDGMLDPGARGFGGENWEGGGCVALATEPCTNSDVFSHAISVLHRVCCSGVATSILSFPFPMP